ncbi:hypothetical protein [uncultured Sphaerochaeta sp.]|uniref:hypothetical protein n=1 Tax=uncultured Sphaerochaeta sp. TaxID=886478 RepID=UPI002A0A6DFF|nr:hypothetical protein [uncultured Sphaerochaeta sp.]
MKKRFWLICLFVLVGILCAGCSSYISKSVAMDVAMQDLGLIQINVSNLEGTINKANTPVMYAITFDYAGQHYVYDIDAKTKDILSKSIL